MDRYIDLERYADLLNVDHEKPPIPELPKTKKELEGLLEKKFQVLKTGEPVITKGEGYGAGGESANNVYLKCPFCKMEFVAIERYGCFHSEITSENCPNCNFPHNVLIALVELSKKRKKKRK